MLNKSTRKRHTGTALRSGVKMCFVSLSTKQYVDIITWIHLIVKVPPLIHPNFSYSSCILIDNLCHPSGESVGTFVPKHMANMGAGYNFKGASTLPNLYTWFQQKSEVSIKFILVPSYFYTLKK